jgi:hypothetical protein
MSFNEICPENVTTGVFSLSLVSGDTSVVVLADEALVPTWDY